MIVSRSRPRRLVRAWQFDPNLVLYLPLYKLDGASFKSADRYSHLCTVTGALWTPQGRTFDGTDDYITVPHNAVFDFGTGAFTWIVWFKSGDTATAWQRILSKGDAGGLYTRIGSNTIATAVGGDDLGSFPFTDTTTFHQLAIIRTGGNAYAYLDLVLQDTVASVGNVNVATDLTIGIRHDLTEDFTGKVGEVLAYNRGISVTELTQINQATKGRY